MPSNRVIFEFADADTVDRFLTWLADGNGDDDFCRFEQYRLEEDDGPEAVVVDFDFSRAFPAWGYDPALHGEDRVVRGISGEKEES